MRRYVVDGGTSYASMDAAGAKAVATSIKLDRVVKVEVVVGGRVVERVSVSAQLWVAPLDEGDAG